MLSPTSRYQFRSTPPPPALVADEEPAPNDPAMDTEADESQLAQLATTHLVARHVSFLTSHFMGKYARAVTNGMKALHLNSTRSGLGSLPGNDLESEALEKFRQISFIKDSIETSDDDTDDDEVCSWNDNDEPDSCRGVEELEDKVNVEKVKNASLERAPVRPITFDASMDV